MRDAAGELYHFETAGDFTLGVGEDLAVLLGDHTRQCIVVAVQEFEELEHDACAGQGWRRRPSGKGRGRGLDRPIDLAGTGEGDPASPLPSRRIVDVARSPVRSGDALAVDVVLDVAHGDKPACRRVT